MFATNDAGLPDASPLLTTEEAADYLRLSVPTLERLRCTGQGPPFIKLGPGKRSRVVYLKNDLEAFLARSRRMSTSDRGEDQ